MFRRVLHDGALMIADEWAAERQMHSNVWAVPMVGDLTFGLLFMMLALGWMHPAHHHHDPHLLASSVLLTLVTGLIIAAVVGLWVTLSAAILAGGGLVRHPENPGGHQNDNHEHPYHRGHALRCVRRTGDWWIAGWTFWSVGSLPVLPTAPAVRIGQPEQIGDAVDPDNQHNEPKPPTNDDESNNGEHQFYDTSSLPVSTLPAWSVFRVLMVFLAVLAVIHRELFSTL